MASVLLLRDNSNKTNESGIPGTLIIGIAVIAAAAVGLAVSLAIVYVCRRRRVFKSEQQCSFKKMPLPADLQAVHQTPSIVRAVSRRNLTPSIVLPLPLPPVPAAQLRSPQTTTLAAHSHQLPKTGVLAHHAATGTIPRAFAPIPTSAFTPTSTSTTPGHSSTPSGGPFNFVLNANAASMRPSLDRTTSPSLHAVATRPGSVVSFSRQSIINMSPRGSLLRTSFSSSSTAAGPTAEALKVYHAFSPLLPDELVLRQGERVGLIRAYDDGWYIVGRRAPWAAPKNTRPGGATPYVFGHPAATSAPDEVEIGAVPAWVFQKSYPGPQKRPMRSASLGVTLVLEESERREDVISWSNF